MEITRDVIFDRFNRGDRVAGIGESVERQMLGIAKVIAAESIRGYKPRDLFAEFMENGNVRVNVSPLFNSHEPVYCYVCHMNVAKVGHTASCPVCAQQHNSGMTPLEWVLVSVAIFLLIIGLLGEAHVI